MKNSWKFTRETGAATEGSGLVLFCGVGTCIPREGVFTADRNTLHKGTQLLKALPWGAGLSVRTAAGDTAAAALRQEAWKGGWGRASPETPSKVPTATSRPGREGLLPRRRGWNRAVTLPPTWTHKIARYDLPLASHPDSVHPKACPSVSHARVHIHVPPVTALRENTAHEAARGLWVRAPDRVSGRRPAGEAVGCPWARRVLGPTTARAAGVEGIPRSSSLDMLFKRRTRELPATSAHPPAPQGARTHEPEQDAALWGGPPGGTVLPAGESGQVSDQALSPCLPVPSSEATFRS